MGSTTGVIIVDVGFLGSEDGYEMLIKAAEPPQKGTDVVIDVVGDNPPETWLGISLMVTHALIQNMKEHGRIEEYEYQDIEDTLMKYMVRLNDNLAKKFDDMGLVQ